MTHATRRTFLTRVAAISGLGAGMGAAALTGCSGLSTRSALRAPDLTPRTFDPQQRETFLTAVRQGNEAVLGFYARLGYAEEPRVSLSKHLTDRGSPRP